ncbi:MAG: YchJ family protein [Aquabacterium sp.]
MSAAAPTQAAACPCGRPAAYDDCCGVFHAALASGAGLGAPDPESLMRSRYTAFVQDRRPYLLATWHPDTRPSLIEAPEPGLKWLGLTVKAVRWDGSDEGQVHFVARYKIGGRAHRLEELSLFRRVDGRWLYVSALHAGGGG